MRMLTEGCSEKYAKTLIGKTELEDALKRLDKLTEEEARMVAEENLKATYTVDKRVQGVADQVAGVDDRLVRVNDRVVTVDDRVKVVDNRVMEVRAGV
jgi:hypothetical protein